jgi:hypothetical protein
VDKIIWVDRDIFGDARRGKIYITSAQLAIEIFRNYRGEHPAYIDHHSLNIHLASQFYQKGLLLILLN